MLFVFSFSRVPLSNDEFSCWYDSKMTMLLLLLLLYVGHVSSTSANKPFIVTGDYNHNKADKVGVNVTWTPSGTRNTFAGSGHWQSDGEYEVGVSADVAVGEKTSVLFGVNRRDGGRRGGYVGVKRRWRRAALAKKLNNSLYMKQKVTK